MQPIEVLINRGMQALIGLLILLALASVFILAWHLLLPVGVHWLIDRQYQGCLVFLILSVGVLSVAKFAEQW